MTPNNLFLLLLLLALAACTASEAPAVQSLETYLQAFVDKDESRLVSQVCPAYEMDALLEYDAFALSRASLEGLTCRQTAQNGEQASVVCQGSIQATYGNEVRSFDLSERTYHVVRSGEEWLVCGYTK